LLLPEGIKFNDLENTSNAVDFFGSFVLKFHVRFFFKKHLSRLTKNLPSAHNEILSSFVEKKSKLHYQLVLKNEKKGKTLILAPAASQPARAPIQNQWVLKILLQVVFLFCRRGEKDQLKKREKTNFIQNVYSGKKINSLHLLQE